LREGFERDSAFQITNTVHFAIEIARQLYMTAMKSYE